MFLNVNRINIYCPCVFPRRSVNCCTSPDNMRLCCARIIIILFLLTFETLYILPRITTRIFSFTSIQILGKRLKSIGSRWPKISNIPRIKKVMTLRLVRQDRYWFIDNSNNKEKRKKNERNSYCCRRCHALLVL